MPKIRMVVQISGTRDGQDWPAPGGIIDVSKDEAEQIIAGGSAIAVDTKLVETATAPAEKGLSKAKAGK